jgi:hypothetical protein
LRLHGRNHQRTGEERRTQDCQSPLHTYFSFILWRLCFAGRMSNAIAIAVPSKNPSQIA